MCVCVCVCACACVYICVYVIVCDILCTHVRTCNVIGYEVQFRTIVTVVYTCRNNIWECMQRAYISAVIAFGVDLYGLEIVGVTTASAVWVWWL